MGKKITQASVENQANYAFNVDGRAERGDAMWESWSNNLEGWGVKRNNSFGGEGT